MGRGASFNELFWPVLQQKQIHFIFTDKVCLLCLSSNTKSPQQQNFTKKSRNKHHSIMFQGWPVSCQSRNKHHSTMFQGWPVSCQNRNKHHSIMFPWWPVSCRCLLLLFLIVTLHSGIKKTLSGSWLNNIEGYLIPLLVLKTTWLQDKSEILLTFKHSYSK